MKHSRMDYQDRVVDLAEKIPANEPVFLLRGQDLAAPAAVRTWAQKADQRGAAKEMVKAAFDVAAEMEAYQKEHIGKVPDCPKPESEKAPEPGPGNGDGQPGNQPGNDGGQPGNNGDQED